MKLLERVERVLKWSWALAAVSALAFSLAFFVSPEISAWILAGGPVVGFALFVLVLREWSVGSWLNFMIWICISVPGIFAVLRFGPGGAAALIQWAALVLLTFSLICGFGKGRILRRFQGPR